MNPQLAALLDQIKQNPTNPKLLGDLTRVYVAPQLTPEQRAGIRAVITSDPRVVTAIKQWAASVPQADPDRYLRLRLLAYAITDAQPDPYQAGMEIEELIKWAHRHEIDAGPHIEAVQVLASSTTATIMHQRLLAWSRTRRFIDGQVNVLLETIRQSPGDDSILESLAALYVHPDTTNEQRRNIRNLVTNKPMLVQRFSQWTPSQKNDDPERWYRLMLGVISLTDAKPDWQKTANRVIELRQFARKNGVDPQEHIDDICKMSTPRTEQVLRRQRL